MPVSTDMLLPFADFYLEHSFEFIVITDNKLSILQSSKSFNEKFPKDNNFNTLVDLISEPERERFLAFYHKANDQMQFMQTLFLLDGQLINAEIHYQKKGEYTFWAISDTSNVSSLKEDVIAFRSTMASEKARTEAMLDSIGDGVIGTDDRGNITFVNEQAAALLGEKEEDLLQKAYIHTVAMVTEKGDAVPFDQLPIHKALMTKARNSSSEYFITKKDGTRFAVSMTSTPIVIFNSVMGGVNVFRDITKEHEIDRMKTEFISLASHQLRTPLSAMKWFGELLLGGDMGELAPEQKELVQQIYTSNERMIELVNALLNISRIESGRIIIEPQLTNLRQLIDEVVVEVRPRMDKKRQRLVVSVYEGLPEILIDPKLVRHVYMNLLTNAIKYTPEEGEIQIIVSRQEDQVITQVTDNGYGIPKAQQEKVFSKFFRAENIIKVETDGTGLGLYLTKAVVDSSGGRIWYESEEGKGTSFWFSLPITGMEKKKGK